MARKVGHLFSRIISIENFETAADNASRSKRNSRAVAKFNAHRREKLQKLHRKLEDHSYFNSRYQSFDVYEPKRRKIEFLPYYPDCIVDHAIIQVMEPIWRKTFTYNTYACIKRRGIHACVRQTKRIIRRYDGKPLFVLQIDITKFFQSIDHDVLKRIIRKKIKDRELLWLMDLIIDSSERGIPIGRYMSQFLSNLYLCYFMHRVNEDERLDAVEYADDIIFFSDSKKRLHEAFAKCVRPEIEGKLNLKIKPNYQVYPLPVNRQDKHGRALDYVGYKFYRRQTLLRKSIKQHLCRAVAKLNCKKNVDAKAYKQYICPWLGWAIHCNSKHLIKKIIKPEYYDECLLRQRAQAA